ncbi:MAG TPA: hypothetical protein VHF27_05085 [Acidimicrobiales bacterium]|nr:hypothetical protein [Acidimicrobiales bacterium]
MRLRRHGDHWLLVGGPVPPGSAAITIGSVVSVRRRHADDPRLLRHEAEHVRQWRELGKVRFVRQYLGAYVQWRRLGFGHQAAYRLIPLEVEAEAAADRVAATLAEEPTTL